MASLVSFARNAVKAVQRDVVHPVVNAVESVPLVRSLTAPTATPQQRSQMLQQNIQRNLPTATPQQRQVIQQHPMATPVQQTSFLNQLANKQNNQDVLNIGKAGLNTVQQFVTRPIVQAATSLVPKQMSVQATNPVTRALIGNTPVQNLEKAAVHNYQTHPNLPLPARIGLSAAYTAGQVANDVPVADAALKGASKAVDAATLFNGLKAKQVIMDTSKLDTLNNARQKMTIGQPLDQKTLEGLHNIKNQNNLDFITGSPADRRQRIVQYLEQNGEAIPKLQARQASINNLKVGNQIGAVGKDVSGAGQSSIPLPALKQEAATPKLQSGNASFKPTPDSVMAKALGIDKAGIAKVNADNASLSAQQKVDLPNKEQMALAQEEGKGPLVNNQLTDEQVKAVDAKNPVKVSITPASPGDYARARAIPQEATAQTRAATTATVNSINKLSLRDKANVLDAIEHPEDYKNASPKLQKAIAAAQNLHDTVSATSHALGGHEPRINNFLRHAVDTSGWNGNESISNIFDSKTSQMADPNNFRGVNAISRKVDPITGQIIYPDKRSLNAAGMHLTNESDPAKFFAQYGKAATNKLEKQALIKGFTEADSNAENHLHSLDLGNGKPLALSQKGLKEVQGYTHQNSTGIMKLVDKPNSVGKHFLLTGSQYHPVNVNALQAFPSLVGAGHPLRAVKGLADTVATAVSPAYSKRLAASDLESGLYKDAARIGMPFGHSDFTASGEMKGGNMVFGRQIPAMQRQVVKAITHDLNKKGISLDSQKARDAGEVGNNIMGFVNSAAKNFDPRVQRTLSRFLLAPQFEWSKLNLVKNALDPTKVNTVAGKYARSAVFGKYAAEAAIAIGAGAVLGQKQNSIKDTLKQTALKPSIPTPLKDSKGNTIKFSLPDSGASEIANLIAKTNRQSNGRLGVNVNNPMQVGSNIATDVRNKFAPLLSDATKVATNTNYAGKQLYDANAPAGTKAQQAGTTLLGDSLPIGTQGAIYNKTVDSHLPPAVQQILKANTPGSNAFVKSALSTVGLTAGTDQTTGKGLQTNQYYTALANATKGLNANDKAAFNSIHQQSKDPVTGQYIIKPTEFDTAAKATLYEQHPNVLAADTKLNQTLAKQGQNVNPFFTQLSPQQQQAYLAYQKMPPGGSDRANWMTNNSSWYKGFSNQMTSYVNKLPASDPNRPTVPIAYPNAPASVASLQAQYDQLPNGAAKATFLNSHPALTDQFNKESAYTNAVRQAQGYQPLTSYPTATPQIEAALNAKNYKAPGVQAYLNQVDLYNIAKQGAQNQYQGTSASQSELKAVQGLGNYGLVKNPDGTLAVSGSTAASNNAIAVGGYHGTGTKSGVAKIAKLKTSKIPRAKLSTYKMPTIKYGSSSSAFKAPKLSKGYSSTTFNAPKAPKVSYKTGSMRSTRLKVTKFKKVKVA